MAEFLKAKLEKLKNFDNEKLKLFSRIMTFLCMIDCSVLPLVTITFSTLNVFKGFDRYTHAISKFIVVPLGGFVAFVNLCNGGPVHRFVTSIVGCLIIYLSHSHLLWDHNSYQSIAISLFGCFLLIYGNWKSHKCTTHKHS